MEVPSFVSVVLYIVFLSACVDAEEITCHFSKYTLEKENEYIKRLSPFRGKSYPSRGEGFSFKVGICANLMLADKPYAAITQTQTMHEKTDTQTHVIGSLKNCHIMGGTDWIMLQYKDGESYRSHCGSENKTSIVMITCDPAIDDGSAEMVYIQEEKTKKDSCYYLFEMKHKLVCPVSTGGSGLSIGSILVIVFFTVLALYLLVGFLYSRFFLGSKGKEQCPNYEFWKDFGNLQADGCEFVCRTKGRKTTGFRGIGDEQLEPTEEIRDDNLLPM